MKNKQINCCSSISFMLNKKNKRSKEQLQDLKNINFTEMFKQRYPDLDLDWLEVDLFDDSILINCHTESQPPLDLFYAIAQGHQDCDHMLMYHNFSETPSAGRHCLWNGDDSFAFSWQKGKNGEGWFSEHFNSLSEEEQRSLLNAADQSENYDQHFDLMKQIYVNEDLAELLLWV
jgi:hypothetical protein